jgi:hypothetical protein
MPTDHNQGRRGHFHRGGRRGPDRRGPERRQGPPPPEQVNRAERTDRVDVEQIMRDIRARIAQRSGVDLSNQQIQELAARRLEAILDPRGLKPELLDQLRRAAGERTAPADAAAASAAQSYPFDEASLYDSPNGFLRFLRKLFHPLLRMLFNPTPIAHALAQQSRLNTELLQRDAERDRRQSEWNALHYEILQRLAIEVSRVSIEAQSQSMRVESLGAKVDFNERRVRTMEGTQTRPARNSRKLPGGAAADSRNRGHDDRGRALPQQSEGQPQPAGDAPRRRRRRRRGRRSPARAHRRKPAPTRTRPHRLPLTSKKAAPTVTKVSKKRPRPGDGAADHRLPAITEHREEATAAPEPIRTEEPPRTPEE